MKHINSIAKNFTTIHSSFVNVHMYEIICNCNKLYTGKINLNFKLDTQNTFLKLN